MIPGALKDYINHIRVSQVQNEYGDITEQETDLGILRAEVKPVSGKESFMSQRDIEEVDYKVTLRGPLVIEPLDYFITSDISGNKKLRIVSILDWKNNSRELTVLCKYIGNKI